MSDQQKRDEPDKPNWRPLAGQNRLTLIDQIIAKAQADGHFDNLPGQGQPLAPDEDELVPQEDRLGYRMLKTAGYAPPWVEAKRAIDDERRQLDEWLATAQRRWVHLAPAGRAALQVTYKRKLSDLQRTIVNFNLTAPPGVVHLEGLRMADELAKLGS